MAMLDVTAGFRLAYAAPNRIFMTSYRILGKS